MQFMSNHCEWNLITFLFNSNYPFYLQVDCNGTWTTWTDCRKGNRTIDCGSGTRFRYFSIIKVAQNGGKDCVGKEEIQSEECSEEKACLDGENLFETRIYKMTSKSKSYQH